MLYRKAVFCALISFFVSQMECAYEPEMIELCTTEIHETCYIDPDSEFGVGYDVSHSTIDILFAVPQDAPEIDAEIKGRLTSVVFTVHMDSDKDWDYVGKLYKANEYGEETLILTQSDSGSAYDMPKEVTFSASDIDSYGLMVRGTYRLELSTQNSDKIIADVYCLKELCFGPNSFDVCVAQSEYSQMNDIAKECESIYNEDDCEDNYYCEWQSDAIKVYEKIRRMAIERNNDCVLDNIVPGQTPPDCSLLDFDECINTSECFWVGNVPSQSECVVDNIIIGEKTPNCGKFGKRRCLQESQCRWME